MIVNGDMESLELLIGEYGADVHARAQGRFFMPEDSKDSKDKMKQATNYDGRCHRLPAITFSASITPA